MIPRVWHWSPILATMASVLFFVVGFYKDTDYWIDYATADNIAGPYQRQDILLQTGDVSRGQYHCAWPA